MVLDNPLLNNLGLPKFDQIEARHVVPAVQQLLAELNKEIDALEAQIKPSWEGLMQPLADMSVKFEAVWRTVGHLMSVKNSPELRTAFETMQEEVVALGLKIGQNKKFYNAYLSIQNSSEWQSMSQGRKRAVESKLLEAKLSGIGLEGKDKERFNELSKKSSVLQTSFSNNVLDSIKDFQLILTQKADLAGLSEDFVAMLSQNYNQIVKDANNQSTPEHGPWLLTLNAPVVVGFMENSECRHLREALSRANATKASYGKYDNSDKLIEILQLRQEKAKLLGYNNFGELSLATKMAQHPEAVFKLEHDLIDKARLCGLKDLKTITDFAHQAGFEGELKIWDTSFWVRKFREHKFSYSEEQLKPYLALPNVLEGVFRLIHRLFAVTIKAADGETSVWHQDVRFFKVFDESNQHIASFYFDPYVRPENKKSGAWVNSCVDKHLTKDGVAIPVAYIVTNNTPPIGDKPCLMTMSDVETLFHEFGHALQQMLTTISDVDVSGYNNVEWDAIELPSQFMENWCYDKDTFFGFAKHYKTGELMPVEFFDKIKEAKTFIGSLAMLRQNFFGLLDMTIHTQFDPFAKANIFELQQKIASEVLVVPLIEEDRFMCGFTHVFSGGYAAGYYSYKWAEVLSADAFAAFEEAGLHDDAAVKKVGRRYRNTILALGGSKHPTEVFREFRGRDATVDALLRHNGLV